MMNLRFTPLLLLVLLAMACAPADHDDATASAGYDPTTYRQDLTRICGADRYTGVQGADVSKYQGNFDWETQQAKGLKFGIARISDGTEFIDQYFDRNWAELKRLGMIRGSYQYFRPSQSVEAQANIVIDKLGRLGPGDLPAVIDVESNGGLSSAQVAARVKEWIALVEAGTGKKPIIYTGPYFWQDNVGDTTLGEHPLWIAHYATTCPLTPDGWEKWTFWQYCDGNTDYCDNGEGFDRNVFNGTLEELEVMAGGSATSTDAEYGAEYVDQSFPLAADAIPMVPNQALEGYIELKNTGEKAWDANTRLATTEPRDRTSPFVDPTWLSANRPAAVSGTVAPGETYRFQFTLRAPNAPGTYAEYFGVVQEGVTWFSDAGQGGPPDDQLQVTIEVTPAPYGAELVDMSFGDSVQLDVGESQSGWIAFSNTGTATWGAGEVLLAPTPRDTVSSVYDQSWLSPTRISATTSDVAPGESFKFPVALTGNNDGTYAQTFNLVTSDDTWFSDSPEGGGPLDTDVAVDVIVGTGMNNANSGVNPDGSGTPIAAQTTFPRLVDVSRGTPGGCAQGGTAGGWPALLVAALAFLRRKD